MRFYLNETKQVLSGKDTADVAKDMGLSHSTISLRVKKTLDALKKYFGIEETLFNSSDVRMARGNAEYWMSLIGDYEYSITPKEEEETSIRYFEALKVVVGAYIKANGLPDDRVMERCKHIAKQMV